MDKPNQLLSLQTPRQDLTTLSFCKPTVRDLTTWIHELPKANIGELARLLYQALVELNRLQATTELRFQLLEIIRPEVSFITKQLEKNHLLQSVILDERGRKVANLCQALQNMLSTGYKLCISQHQMQEKTQRNNILAYAIQRAIQSLYSALARSYQLYYPVPAGLWFDLHQLYLLACKHSIQTIKLTDPLLGNLKEQTIEQAYSCALLLGCARINQMRQRDIALLASSLPSWCHLASIQDVNAPSTLFVIAPHSDTPPRYKALLNISKTEILLGLDTRALANTLEEWVHLPQDKKSTVKIPIPAGAQPTFIYQLCSAWGDIAKRDFKRTPSSGTLELCLGMTAVHYYLSGKISFDDTLVKPHTSKASYSYDNRAPDIWANAFDAQNTDKDSLLEEIIEYTPQEQAETVVKQEVATVYPTYSTCIINQSPGGYCLEWNKDAPSQLQAGDIIGLSSDSCKSWVTAVIRWIRQIRNGGAQIGVELLAPNAQPCGVQLLRPGEDSSNYLRGLLVPEIPAISRSASLITPRIPFQEGSRVNINHAGVETKATLGKRSIHTASISQYEYKISAAVQPTQVAPSVEAPNVAVSTFATVEAKPNKPADDFDSLWKIL